MVAIIADRSLEMLEGIYGIIKSGGAYVPIDPTYPEDRIKYMLEDSKPKAVIVYTNEKIVVNDNKIPVLNLADDDVWTGKSENLERISKSEDLLYCIYTSGTTGKPKGVMLQNSSVVNYCSNQKYSVMDYAYKNELNTVISVTNMVFDIFVTETHLALINGFKIILANSEEQSNPEKLNELLLNQEPEIMQTTPSRIKLMLSGDCDLSGVSKLKYIMLGGEKVERTIINSLKKYTDAVIEDVYGPTETTVWSSCCEIKDGEGQISIGKPISNTQIYIVDSNNLCGIGMPGELCIAGDGLARGYLNRPELTAEKFVDNPYGEGKMYRTGDLARWLSDGSLEYLGRMDEQVKIRGFRIELGEIEERLKEIEGIKEAAVVARTDGSGEKSIFAYFVTENKKEITISDIRGKLSDNLPDYMIPSYMMQIDSIPVTKNGKLDKRALPNIEVKTEKEYIAPRNKEEKLLCDVFAEVLGVKEISVKDNFFELGGDSIKAIKIISQIRDGGYTVTVKDIMSKRVVEKIALSLIPEICSGNEQDNEETESDLIVNIDMSDIEALNSLFE